MGFDELGRGGRGLPSGYVRGTRRLRDIEAAATATDELTPEIILFVGMDSNSLP
jgi:hypothetical protein